MSEASQSAPPAALPTVEEQDATRERGFRLLARLLVRAYLADSHEPTAAPSGQAPREEDRR